MNNTEVIGLTAALTAQVNPLAAYSGGIASLFSTHPPTERRVAALRAMADKVRSGAR